MFYFFLFLGVRRRRRRRRLRVDVERGLQRSPPPDGGGFVRIARRHRLRNAASFSRWASTRHLFAAGALGRTPITSVRLPRRHLQHPHNNISPPLRMLKKFFTQQIFFLPRHNRKIGNI